MTLLERIRNIVHIYMADSYKVLAIPGPGQDLQLQTRDLSPLSPTGVLVKVRAVGVCHTDLHYWQGYFSLGNEQKVYIASRPGYGYPIVPGHEIAGEVAALGPQAKDESSLKVGGRVTVYPWGGCQDCGVCKSGDSHVCAGITKELGINIDGGYAEYVVLSHYKFAVEIPECITNEVAAMAPCSILTTFSAIRKCTPTIERVRKWQMELFVVVIGLGGLGQWAVKLLKDCRIVSCPAKVVGVDINTRKLELVRQEKLVDSTFLFNTSKQVKELVGEFLAKFDKCKPHVVLDFVNCPETFGFARSLLHKGGCQVPVGLLGGAGEVPLPVVALNAHTIAGSCMGSLAELQELIGVLQEQVINPPPITTYSLEEGQQALQDLQDGRILGRAILKVK